MNSLAETKAVDIGTRTERIHALRSALEAPSRSFCTELGRLFMELAEMEWKHKTDLQAEYDLVAGPDQFLLDI